jgi:cold shock CspA family protein
MELPNTFFNHDAQAGGFYPKSHVGIDVSRFGRKQNTLVEGIRGTGKTHILRMISRYHLENFDKLKILPIYISLAQISEHARKEPDEFRLHLYAHIVQRCVETAEIYRSYLQSDKTLLENALFQIARLFRIKTEPKFNDLLHQIKQIADLLLFKLQFDLTSKSFKDMSSELESISGKVGVNVSAKSPIEAGVSSELQNTISASKGTEESLSYFGSRLVHKDAATFLIEFLKQIQVILNLDYSLLLLDECSEASFSSQVEIFRLFKTIRGATSGLASKETCAFFIGTVYPRGETYYPTRDQDNFSFEIGQDCTMEFLQWDETDLESYISFFENMTLNRAKEVIGYEGTFEDLSNAIFENKNAFKLAAYCAHGIPRRYWEIVKRSYDYNSEKVLFSRVEISIQEIANEQILGHDSLKLHDSDFIYALIRSIKNQNQRTQARVGHKRDDKQVQNLYFSINRKFTDNLRRLVMQGAVHEKSRMRTMKKVFLRPQPVYALDMAVAYTFQAISNIEFVSTITKDLPLCRENDFRKAVVISARGIERIYSREPAASKEEYIEIVDDTEAEDGQSGEVSTGRVVLYAKGKSGKIKADDGGLDALFQDNNIKSRNIKVGDTVRFTNRWTKGGERLALQIEKAPMPKTIEGIVKSYEQGAYGSIEVLDGGPDAFFTPRTLSSNLIYELKPGDRVRFTVIETRLGRQAENISLKVAADLNKATKLPDELSEYVVKYVKSSPSPVPMAKVAHQVRNYFGDNVSNTQWFGYGTFKNLLSQLDLEDLDISPVGPSYLYYPKIHSISPTIEISIPEVKDNPDELRLKDPTLANVARKVHQVGIPYLTSEQYQILFEELASTINQDGFNIPSQLTKTVRDKCNSRGYPIARSNINFVVIGFSFVGHHLGTQQEDRNTLALLFVKNIFNICKNKNISLSHGEEKIIEKWISGDS